jgi:predicted kinase
VTAVLIAFGGLPGTGKSTVAQALARALGAVYLRIDTLEQAFLDADCGQREIGPQGYMAAYAVAADNLRLGSHVVADSVNALPITRNAWRDVAHAAGALLVEIELICTDATLHRQRVETRESGIAGHRTPTWQSVQERQYEQWDSAHLVIDTAKLSVEQAIAMIIGHLSQPDIPP